MNTWLLRRVHHQRSHFHPPKVASWHTGIQSGPNCLETFVYSLAAVRMFTHASGLFSGSVQCPPCRCTRMGPNQQRRPNELPGLGALTAYGVPSSGTYGCANPKGSKDSGVEAFQKSWAGPSGLRGIDRENGCASTRSRADPTSPKGSRWSLEVP